MAGVRLSHSANVKIIRRHNVIVVLEEPQLSPQALTMYTRVRNFASAGRSLLSKAPMAAVIEDKTIHL